jgi:hypothetical protein
MCTNAGQAKEVFHRFSAAVEKYIGIHPEYLGYILRDESLRAAVTLQNPVALFPETDPSCSSFVRLADTLDRATADSKDRAAFSAYWQKQYRNQGRKPDEAEEQEGSQETTEFSAESRDNDYLSELRSRMLLMIEQGNAEPEQIAEVLQESADAFLKRNKHSPVDLLGLLDQLIADPDHDEALMTEVYERVKPWGVGYDAPPTSEMMEGLTQQRSEVALSVPDDVPQDIVEEIRTPAANDTALDVVEVVASNPVNLEESAMASDPAASSVHHLDDERFGSQSHLLEQLRKQASQGQSVADWLTTLH